MAARGVSGRATEHKNKTNRNPPRPLAVVLAHCVVGHDDAVIDRDNAPLGVVGVLDLNPVVAIVGIDDAGENPVVRARVGHVGHDHVPSSEPARAELSLLHEPRLELFKLAIAASCVGVDSAVRQTCGELSRSKFSEHSTGPAKTTHMLKIFSVTASFSNASIVASALASKIFCQASPSFLSFSITSSFLSASIRLTERLARFKKSFCNSISLLVASCA